MLQRQAGHTHPLPSADISGGELELLGEKGIVQD
jgi:hypothetical protein